MADRDGDRNLKAFPGAVGYGADTAGGRGGAVVKVTNLNDSGEGSLRWALEDLSGPRTVIFDVGGTINLEDRVRANGEVTIAGQTAPGEGVTLTGAPIKVAEDDVIIRGIKSRIGTESDVKPADLNGIIISDRNDTVERVIIDSSSFTWAVDENVTTYYAPRNITFSNNIIAEGLNEATHAEGAHSMGLLLGDDTERVTITGNLFSDNNWRNPLIKDSREIEVFNNLVYNWGEMGTQGEENETPSTAHIAGNVYIAGPDTKDPPLELKVKEEGVVGSTYYFDDNWTDYVDDEAPSGAPDLSDLVLADPVGDGTRSVVGAPSFAGSGAQPGPASEVFDAVVAKVGPRAQGLDAVDERIISEVLDRSGGIIDAVSDVPRHTPPTVRTQLADQDDDGIPDVYEAIVGSNAAVFDANGDVDGDGYTNIEEYINGLIDGFDAQPQQPTPPAPDPAPDPAPGPVAGPDPEPPVSEPPVSEAPIPESPVAEAPVAEAPVSEARVDLGATAKGAEIAFAVIDDANGGMASVNVAFLLDDAVVERQQIRVAVGEDRTVALTADAEFDALRLSDAEGDVTFAIAETTPEAPAPTPVSEAPVSEPPVSAAPVSEATVDLGATARRAEIEFAVVSDASGDTARIDVDFLLGGALVETARIRVAEGEDRAVALSAPTEFDGLRLSDAEGDVTFAIAETAPPPAALDAPAPILVSEATVDLGESAAETAIEFAAVADASGDTANINIDFLLGGAVVESQKIRVAEGEDRFVALSAAAEFDALRLSDAEGDVTFALSSDTFAI